jgi:3'-5' exoribonuclease 1
MASPPLGFLESFRLSWQVNVLLDHWVACMLVMIAICLTRSVYKRFGIQHKNEAESKTPSSELTPFPGFSFQFWHRLKSSEVISVSPLVPQPSNKSAMRYQRTPRRVKAKKKLMPTAEPPRIPGVVQPFEAFLVLDIEGTCNQGTDFDYPNEIIVRVVLQPTSTPNIVFFLLGTPSLLAAMEG